MYTHTKKSPVVLKNDPISPGDTDWVYFSYGDWLRAGETVTAHSAEVTGGTRVMDSTYLGDMMDSEGTTLTEVYGVKFTAGDVVGTSVVITHRKSTTTTGAVDLGRTNIDHSAILSVKTL